MLVTTRVVLHYPGKVGTTNLLIHETMEDEDEDALKAVEYCEEIRHNNRLCVYVEESKRPRWAEQHYQHYCSFDVRSKNITQLL